VSKLVAVLVKSKITQPNLFSFTWNIFCFRWRCQPFCHWSGYWDNQHC